MMTSKPGWKTTEFWISFIVTIVGLVTASGILEGAEPDSWPVKAVGLVTAVLASLGYTASRTNVKR